MTGITQDGGGRIGTPEDCCEHCVSRFTETFLEYRELPWVAEQLETHGELDVKTLRYHLEQADATAKEDCWHASVNEARCFVEALIVGIAEYEASKRHHHVTGVPTIESKSGYQECRKYLVNIGFADADAMDFFKQAYALASRKGSHPGVTDETWGRLISHLCWTGSYLLLQRYAAWKQNGRTWTAPRRTRTRKPRQPGQQGGKRGRAATKSRRTSGRKKTG